MDIGDESDDSSTSSLPYVDPLDDFRDKWQQEIENKSNQSRNVRTVKQLLSPDAVNGDEEKVLITFDYGTKSKNSLLKLHYFC